MRGLWWRLVLWGVVALPLLFGAYFGLMRLMGYATRSSVVAAGILTGLTGLTGYLVARVVWGGRLATFPTRVGLTVGFSLIPASALTIILLIFGVTPVWAVICGGLGGVAAFCVYWRLYGRS